MPTYTIDTQGDPAYKAWAEGASALADALTPDYEEQAKAALYGARADQAYSASAYNLANRDKTVAETGLINRERGLLAEMDTRLEAAGITDPLEKSQIVAEFGMQIDPVEWTKNMGSGNLALGMLDENVDEETIGRLQTGAGMDYAKTLPGYNRTQRNENQKWLGERSAEAAQAQAELDQALAIANADRAARAELEMNKPVPIGENQVVIVPENHPLRGQSEDGILFGNRSVGANELILDPTGEPVVQGPDFRADEPQTFKINEGNEEVTFIFAPEDTRANEYGFVEISRAPRVGEAGQPVQDAAEAAFSEDDALTLGLALSAGRGASDMIVQIDQTLEMLNAGVPTGFWTNKTLPIRQALVSMGIADEQATGRIEAITADLGNRVMARIQETKGAVSNAEMDYFRKISASVGNTPFGNRLMLLKERAVHERAQRMRNYALTLRGLPPDEIARKLEEFREANPIFTPEEIRQFAGLEPNPELGLEVRVPNQGEPDLSTVDLDRY